MAVSPKFKLALLLWLPLLCLFSIDKIAIVTVAMTNHFYWRQLGGEFTGIAAASFWYVCSITLALLTVFAAHLSKDKNLRPIAINVRNWSSHLFLALLGTGLVTQILKLCVGRERPCFTASSPHLWHSKLFHGGYLYSSFPSGHSQVIFCVASLLCMLLPRFRIPIFAIALAVACTRVLVLKHFPSDVAFGMILGIYGSRLSVKYWSTYIPRPAPLLASH